MVKTRPLPLPSDSEIVAMKKKDPEMIVEMIFSFRAYLMARIRRYLPPQATYEDVEDVFMRFCSEDLPRIIRKFNPKKGNFENYFNRSLTYRCLHERKATCARKLVEQPIDILGSSGEDDVKKIEIPDDSHDKIHGKVYQKEISEVLGQCIERLPEKSKRVVLLYLNEMSEEEIALLLGMTPGNVRVILHRAKNQLRICLKKKKIID